MLHIILAAVLALVTATSGFAYASDAAEPGDVLYGLDRAIEQVRLDLAPDAAGEAALLLAFSDERLEEALNRQAEGDFENTQVALTAYGDTIAELAKLIAGAEGIDQDALMDMVEAAFKIHLDVLEQITAPNQAAQDAIQKAIDASDIDISPGSPDDIELPEEASPPEEIPPAPADDVELPEEASPPEEIPPAPADDVELPEEASPPEEIPPSPPEEKSPPDPEEIIPTEPPVEIPAGKP